MLLTIPPEIKETISNHAISIHPNECCGFLYGFDREDGTRDIKEAIPVTNSKDGSQRDRFEILPEDYMQAEQYARDQKISFLGIYHSHPDSPAIVSEYDHSHAFPFFSYIIVSVSTNSILDFKSWILDDDLLFQEEEITFL